MGEFLTPPFFKLKHYMTVLTAYKYVQDRMNKLSTNDNNNIPKHSFVDAFNVHVNYIGLKIKLNFQKIIL